VKGLSVALRDYARRVVLAAVCVGVANSQLPSLPFAFFAVAFALVLRIAGATHALAILCCACLIGGAAVGQVRLAAIDTDRLAAHGHGVVELRGIALEHPRDRQFGISMRVRVLLPDGATQKVEVRAARKPGPISIGDEVLVRGRLKDVRDARGTAQARSYSDYLLREGVRRRIQAVSIESSGRRRTGLLGAIDGVRRRSERALAFGLAPEPAALLRGMVLGGDNGIPERTTEDFKVAGLTHILAVSGANIMLLVILVEAISKALGVGRRPRLFLPVGLILIYVPLCGGQASVVRAGVMGLAALAAIAASRPASRIYAMLLAAAFLLVWNPRATDDIGAQLSFVAVAGIMLFAKPVARRLAHWPDWAADAFAATFGATITTAPLMAFHFGQLSLISLIANVVAAPLIGPIVWLGSLAAAIGQLSLPLAALMNAPTQFLLGALITVAHLAAEVPGAQVSVSRFGAIEMTAMFVPIAALAARLRGLIGPMRSSGSSMTVGSRRGFMSRTRMLAWVFFVVGVAVVAASLMMKREALPRPSIVALDVGQGDATLLLGNGGCEALIDGGPPGAGIDRRLRALGIDQLDLVVATHAQQDHYGGLSEIVQAGRPSIETVFDGGGVTDDHEFNSMRKAMRSRKTRVIPAIAGASWNCGDLSLKVIGPQELKPGESPPEDPNQRATVTVATVGSLTYFASADAESPQLLALQPTLADVMKVPHHGSADPGLPRVLQSVNPTFALIEVGRRNRYGHPTEPTLAALRTAVPHVFRTDLNGEVVITADGPDSFTTRVEHRGDFGSGGG
jgi:competence protein ComEC